MNNMHDELIEICNAGMSTDGIGNSRAKQYTMEMNLAWNGSMSMFARIVNVSVCWIYDGM